MLPFNPNPIPPLDLEVHLNGLTTLVGKANAALSRYDGLLEGLINPEVLLSPLILKEAEFSSRIEGTVATASDVYAQEAGESFDENKSSDIQEILNYRQAMRMSRRQIRDRPISLHMIRELHSVLMQGVRGEDKNPVQFRATQNWIGPRGCAVEEATYVPPSPITLNGHLDALQSSIQSDYENIDPIVMAALVHAQFELIHPFDDGNGRIGRVLIPLFLTQVGSISSPSLYISEYLEMNREVYIEQLQQISNMGNWKGWIIFFLEAVIAESQKNLLVVRQVNELYERMKTEIHELTHSQNTINIVDTLFDRPIFRASHIYEQLDIERATAAQYVRQMKAGGILRELVPSSGRRAALLIFTPLMDIVS